MIQKLDSNTINKIAAGEVVERPVSIVKELIENSLDADSSKIEIIIKNNPTFFIEVKDNGNGIKKNEIELAFQRHATSKIDDINDLMGLNSLGFRGEALPSIASVSYLTAISRHKDEKIGGKIVFDGGEKALIEDNKSIDGTLIRVERLFYNVPARKKYVKSPFYEMRLIKEYIGKIGLAYSEKNNVEFKLTKDGNMLLNYTKYDDINDRIAKFYDDEIADNLLFFEKNQKDFSVKGYITSQNITRKNSTEMNFFINKRLINNRRMIYTVKNALSEILESGEYPYLFLFLEIDPEKIDVNVHPQKSEVRIVDEKKIFSTIYHQVKNLFTKIDSVSTVDYSKLEELKEDNGIKNREFDKLEEDQKSLFQNNDFSNIKRNHSINENIRLFDYRYEGVIFERYLFFVSNSEILFVDFHALNERILYDKLVEEGLEKYKSHIIPEAVTLSSKDYDYLIKNKDILGKIGIEFRDFGEKTIVVETVPNFTYKDNIGAEKIIKNIVENMEKRNDDNPYKDILSRIACRGSLKSGDKLNEEDVKTFVEYIEKGGLSLTCPHGRPIIKKLTKDNIDKWFGRK